MTRICILSDTHGLLRDEVKAEIIQSDIVLHAGDVGAAALEALEQLGDLRAVRGNTDSFGAERLPRILVLRVEDVRFLIVHDQQDVPKDLADIDVVVCGHSHQHAAERRGGVLYLNPGSCGRRRFRLGLSYCRMVVDGAAYHYEKVELT